MYTAYRLKTLVIVKIRHVFRSEVNIQIHPQVVKYEAVYV